MVLKRLAVMVALATLPAFAQVPSATSPETKVLEILRQNATMKLHAIRADGGVESYNWSGYAVTGSDFTSAKGSWKVTKADCAKTPNSYEVAWVGIDGYSDSTVEQTGTLTYCDGSTAEYYAWYEFYPLEDIEVINDYKATPGDVIDASISFADGEFTLTITNETTGKTFSKKGKQTAKRASAEWILEAPASSSGILPLADYGTISFGDDYTDVTGTNTASDKAKTGPISDFGTANVKEITMVNESTKAKESVPTALTTDGSSFKVSWKSE
jgi:hypothetical protein